MSQTLHIISSLVENKPGVLYRVSNMFRSRGFNIESITIAPTQQRDISRITLGIISDELTVEQLMKQLKKLIDVIDVSLLKPENTVYRELALIKLQAEDTILRSDIMNYANIYRSRIVDVTQDTITVEVTGTPDKIDAFLRLTEVFGVKEIARTGVTALTRG